VDALNVFHFAPEFILDHCLSFLKAYFGSIYFPKTTSAGIPGLSLLPGS
jgi:hypothetical protein